VKRMFPVLSIQRYIAAWADMPHASSRIAGINCVGQVLMAL
jgi:hypothetical protein